MRFTAVISRDAVDALREHLHEGERILWIGQPDTSIVLTRADILLVPISLWLGIYTLSWGLEYLEKSLTGAGSPVGTFLVFTEGIAMVMVGLYVTLGRFVYKNWRKRRTYYAVTDQKVLAVTNTWPKKVFAELISDLPDVRRFIHSNGIGTVTFGRSYFMASWCSNTGINCSSGFDALDLIAFHDIKAADYVYELVNKLRSESQNPPA